MGSNSVLYEYRREHEERLTLRFAADHQEFRGRLEAAFRKRHGKVIPSEIHARLWS